MSRGILATGVAIAGGLSAWAIGGGPAALLYIVVFALALVPGLPFGFYLFGRHPAGWIAGALLGYVLTALAIWIVIAARVPTALAFGVAWLLVGGAVWTIWWPGRGGNDPAVPLPSWRTHDAGALAAVLLLTLLIATPPLAKVGARDAEGNRYYRAYFTADFVWHMALTAELSKFAMPPRNPYMAHRRIHYYWTYFLLPAAVSGTGPPPLDDVERCLKLNALGTGLLFVSAVFTAAWIAVPRPWAIAASSALVLAASSLEGLYTLARVWWGGLPLSTVADLNIDAITAWQFSGHRIDGLQRCLWYVPQHAMAYAIGFMAIGIAAAAGSTRRLAIIALAGLTLGGSTVLNPFVGGVFALTYGGAVTLDALRRGGAIGRIARHALAAAPVAVALLWCATNDMVEGAAATLQFGWNEPSRDAPLLTLFLSVGPVLLASIAGLLVRGPVPFGRLTPAVLLASISIALLYFVRLSVDAAWVGFRAGQMMLAALTPAAARFFASAWDRGCRACAWMAAIPLLLAGAPTTLIDLYNAQDISNRSMGPGFPWTVVVTSDQRNAFSWIRAHTPAGAIVQMDPTVRQRSTWSVIPSFAHRRMAAGLPISLLDVPEYHERSERVRRIYATADAHEAWQVARSLRIDYLYVDDVERAAHPAAGKFDSSAYFEAVFRQGPVTVYQVRRSIDRESLPSR